MKRWRSIIALSIIVLLVLSMLTTFAFSFKAYGAGGVSDMQNELDDLVAKRERLEKELASIKGKKEAALEQKAIVR